MIHELRIGSELERKYSCENESQLESFPEAQIIFHKTPEEDSEKLSGVREQLRDLLQRSRGNKRRKSDRIPSADHFSIDYGGTLATKMDWNYQELDRIQHNADMRMHVTISNSPERPQRQMVQMGEVLAWKGIKDIRELFKSKTDFGPEMQVETNVETAQARIIIKDKIISERLREEEGKLDEARFINTVDSKLRKGILSVVTLEKLGQALGSTYIDARLFGLEAILTTLSYPMFQASKDFALLNTNTPIDLAFKVMSIGTAAIAVLMPIASAKIIKDKLDFWSEIRHLAKPYLDQKDDLFAPKHILNLLYAHAPLLKNQPIVRRKEAS